MIRPRFSRQFAVEWPRPARVVPAGWEHPLRGVPKRDRLRKYPAQLRWFHLMHAKRWFEWFVPSPFHPPDEKHGRWLSAPLSTAPRSTHRTAALTAAVVTAHHIGFQKSTTARISRKRRHGQRAPALVHRGMTHGTRSVVGGQRQAPATRTRSQPSRSCGPVGSS